MCSGNAVHATGTSDKKPVSARITPVDGGFELVTTEDGKTQKGIFKKVGGGQNVGGVTPVGGGSNPAHNQAQCPNYSGSYRLIAKPTVKAVVMRDGRGSLSISFDGSTPVIVDGTEHPNGVNGRITASCQNSIIYLKGIDDEGKSASGKISPAGDGFDIEVNGEEAASYRR